MNESAFETQLRSFRDALTGPEGVIALLAMVLLVVGVLSSRRIKWAALAVMLWMATFSFFLGSRERPETLAQPLNMLRVFGRPITVVLLLSLLVPTMTSSRGWRHHVLGIGLITYFFFEMTVGFRTAAGGVATRGALSMLLFPLIFLVMGVGLGRWLQDWRDARAVIGCIVWSGLLLLGGTCFQLLMNRGAIIHNTRLFSTTGNPQHAALVIAIALPPICYLIAQKTEWKVWRLLLAVAAGFLIIMLIWTGLRTGLLVAVTGIVLLFRARVGKLALVGLLVGLSVWLAMQCYTESTRTIAGMLTRGDSRTHAWIIWWEQFRSNMMWGVMTEQYGAGENSYLTTAANMGLFGLIPLMIFMVAAAWQLLRLQLVRHRLGDQVMLADLATAGLVSLAIGAVFEGFLLGALTMPVFCIYIYLGLVTFLCDAVNVSQTMPVEESAAWEAEQYPQEQVPSYEPVMPVTPVMPATRGAGFPSNARV